MVNLERMLEEFLTLVRIDSAPRQERLIADALVDKLTQMGYAPDEDQAGEAIGGNTGNLFLKIPGNLPGPTVMFCAHMDRVFPGFGIKPQVLIDRVISDGTTILAADDLAGVVQILEALRCLQEEKLPHAPLEILFTVSEEGGLFGAKNFDATRSQADYAFFLDGGGEVGNLVVQAPSQAKITVVFNGRAAHAGLEPEKGLNAIVVAAHALTRMELGRIDQETTANVGIINGGSATNIVPDRVEIRCEARSLQGAKLTDQVDKMVKACQEAADTHGAAVEVTVEESYPSYCLEESAMIVKLAQAASHKIGRQPKLVPTGGGSDANILTGRGIASMVLANGLMNAHRLDEYILLSELTKGAEQVLQLILMAPEFTA